MGNYLYSLLPRMASGEVRGAFSMSELGSDVSPITSKGAREGEDFLLTGQKT